MASLDDFNQQRPILFGLAYRMLGNVMDAEDILQEAFLRWQQTDQATVQMPKAFLVSVVTRLCIDQLRLAHVQREEYIGTWLPEPLFQLNDDDPANTAELADSISTAFLVLLERLSPPDRAVLLLHDVFGYTFEEIGIIVDKSAADCRQIAHRSRERVTEGRPRFETAPEKVEQVAQEFMRTCYEGDITGLLSILAEDVILWTDSGGKVRGTVRNPIKGADRVARFFTGIQRSQSAETKPRVSLVNGQPAVIVDYGNNSMRVHTFEIVDGRIRAIYRFANPDKLRSLMT
jgi:RNA polymerase sigma-70 factor (ECF subfamily)